MREQERITASLTCTTQEKTWHFLHSNSIRKLFITTFDNGAGLGGWGAKQTQIVLRDHAIIPIYSHPKEHKPEKMRHWCAATARKHHTGLQKPEPWLRVRTYSHCLLHNSQQRKCRKRWQHSFCRCLPGWGDPMHRWQPKPPQYSQLRPPLSPNTETNKTYIQ